MGRLIWSKLLKRNGVPNGIRTRVASLKGEFGPDFGNDVDIRRATYVQYNQQLSSCWLDFGFVCTATVFYVRVTCEIICPHAGETSKSGHSRGFAAQA